MKYFKIKTLANKQQSVWIRLSEQDGRFIIYLVAVGLARPGSFPISFADGS